MMSDKDNNLLKSDILTVGSELSEKLNAIGVPNTFGKASEGKDNLMSIIRMTINGIDMIIEQIKEKLKDYYNKSEVNTLLNGKSDTSHNHDSAYASKNHNHDSAYASKNHNHDSAYANISHNHNNAYANISHNHDNAYANISHNHDNAYASKSHQHDGADVILSNNNDVGTEIGTIEDDITSINGNITSLNNSITNLEKRFFINITPSEITNASTWTNVNNGKIRLHRVGNICIASGGFQLKAKYSTVGWKQIARIPIGYKSDYSVELRNGSQPNGKIADRIQVNGYGLHIYCGTANTESTEYIMFDLVWVTSDDYPS